MRELVVELGGPFGEEAPVPVEVRREVEQRARLRASVARRHPERPRSHPRTRRGCWTARPGAPWTPMASTAAASGAAWDGVSSVSTTVAPSSSTTSPALARPWPLGCWRQTHTWSANCSRWASSSGTGPRYPVRDAGTSMPGSADGRRRPQPLPGRRLRHRAGVSRDEVEEGRLLAKVPAVGGRAAPGWDGVGADADGPGRRRRLLPDPGPHRAGGPGGDPSLNITFLRKPQPAGVEAEATFLKLVASWRWSRCACAPRAAPISWRRPSSPTPSRPGRSRRADQLDGSS